MLDAGTDFGHKDTIRRDIPLSILCAVVLLACGIAGIGDTFGMTLGHLDGILFLILFAGYIGLMLKSALSARSQEQKEEWKRRQEAEEELAVSVPFPKSLLFIVGGAIAICDWRRFDRGLLPAGSPLTLVLTQTLVGLTIGSIRNVSSGVGDFYRRAARKNEVDMARGKCGGFQIFLEYF